MVKAWVLIPAALVIIVLALATGFVQEKMLVGDVTGTVVKEPYVKKYGDHDQFMIDVNFADGTGETFKNIDSWWWLKFNSADFQREIKYNKTYHFTVIGWRNGFFSSFRNIVKYESV